MPTFAATPATSRIVVATGLDSSCACGSPPLSVAGCGRRKGNGLLLVLLQRWAERDPSLGVRFMHRPRIVSQRVLGPPLWIAAGSRPFRPRIAVAMEAHALDLRQTAPAAEFSGPR